MTTLTALPHIITAETLHVHKEGGRNGESNGRAEFSSHASRRNYTKEAANRREKQIEEELKAQEASRSKVMEWMKTTDVGGS